MLIGLLIFGYMLGWLVYIFTFGARDSLGGAVAIFTGIIWPLFALGWVVGRLGRD